MVFTPVQEGTLLSSQIEEPGWFCPIFYLQCLTRDWCPVFVEHIDK